MINTTPEHKRRSVEAMKLAHQMPRPKWLTNTYEAFLAHLRQQHGDEYLLRPDGELLEPRKP